MQLNAIGTFRCHLQERYSQPHQPQAIQAKVGYIQLESYQNYEMACDDLNGFEKIWLIFGFNKSKSWKPKVLPPRNDGQKKGVFATRSPHRPNRLGLSCVDLVEINGLNIHIKNHDLLDKTPIYDIKPYLPSYDAFPEAKSGWVDNIEDKEFSITWSEQANAQKIWLDKNGLNINNLIDTTLRFYPQENDKRRVTRLPDSTLQLAVKTWRVHYNLYEDKKKVNIKLIRTGYDKDTLEGKKNSKWQDVPLHIDYVNTFY